MHYVYILRDELGKNYVGYSENLKKRLDYHENGSVTTTKRYTAPKLIWYCAFREKTSALRFEKYLKAGSGHAFSRKHLLI